MSDWSSDVCSSDLIQYGQAENCLADEPGLANLIDDCWQISARMLNDTPVAELDALTATADERDFETVAQHVREAIAIGRASGRDRVCQYVYVPAVVVELKKKKRKHA